MGIVDEPSKPGPKAHSKSVTLVLVPGFFAFERFANIPYFAGVHRLLPGLFAHHGYDVQVLYLSLPPTASIELRAWALLQRLSALRGTTGPIFLVGHSSGGLDIRLALRSELWSRQELPSGVGAVLERISAVVTISTPHFGTPLASIATGLRAHQVLRLLSWVFVKMFRHGHLPMGWMLQAGRVLARVDDLVGLRGNILDQLYDELLVHAPRDYFQELEAHFQRVGAHQGLIGDLAPNMSRRRNQLCVDCPRIRYGCILSRAARPNWQRMMQVGLDPYAQLSFLVYRNLHRLTSQVRRGSLPRPSGHDCDVLRAAYGELPSEQDNDGIIPTRSQLWGELIHAVSADHFDTMGYFAGRDVDPMHVNWLASGSWFSPTAFELMWRKCVDFLMRDAK